MPALEIKRDGIAAISIFAAYLQQLLDRADEIKPTRALEPMLSKSDFNDFYGGVDCVFSDFKETGPKKRQYAIVETAVRETFIKLVAACSIDSPDFSRVWNLLDIIALLADNKECDAALLFWLIEELLDGQTIPGCRRVFDYLESRRERTTAKFFTSAKLILLRSCNDLLRRLSRAEDTPFCGRVFIFLFQMFPLGDKSSVNLRGEFHVENVTTYDELPPAATDDNQAEVDGADKDPMEIDSNGKTTDTNKGNDGNSKNKGKNPDVNFDTLYPVFWSLQASFCQPKRLFDAAHFAQFKAGMEVSMAAFHKISDTGDASRNLRHLDETKRGLKRKRDKGEGDDLADTYNPKYLTSRDLFELETRDLTFRRHFLLQALIMMEFLLSLSSQAKKRLATVNVQNKSVVYPDQVLSDEDAAWVAKTKENITDHILHSNQDGPYFLRMIDTILARDKNWVRWKVESCPPIERQQVSTADFVAAMDGAQRAFGRPHRRRGNAIGSFSLDFLDDDRDDDSQVAPGQHDDSAMRDRLPPPPLPDRYVPPPLTSWRREIADEDFEINMTNDEAVKKQAQERKASKTWRALRLVRQSHLTLFDKLDDDNDLEGVFAAAAAAAARGDEDEDDGDDRGEGGGEAVAEDEAGNEGDNEKNEKNEGDINGATNGANDVDDSAPVNRDSLPSDMRPVVLVVPAMADGADGGDDAAVDQAATAVVGLARRLRRRNSGVFGLVAQHTTKLRAAPAPAAGETDPSSNTATQRVAAAPPLYTHVATRREFDVLLDGDKFVAFGETGGHMYGTHKGGVDAVAGTGKVPLVLMNEANVLSARDNNFSARYVLVQVPGRSGSVTEDSTRPPVDQTVSLGGDSGNSDNDTEERAAKALEAFIYKEVDDPDVKSNSGAEAIVLAAATAKESAARAAPAAETVDPQPTIAEAPADTSMTDAGAT